MSNGVFALHACRKVLTSFRERGAKETIDLIRKNAGDCARRYLNWRFDRKYQVDTAGIIELKDLTCEGTNKDHGVYYEPTSIKTLKFIFSLLPTDVSDFAFIDFGSGKGRTILYASSRNFRRIIGVEFAKELHNIAVRNIRTYRNGKQKCHDISSICLDAAKFSLPAENSILYFFNPFRNEVMATVLDNIERSYRQAPRKLIVVYYNPTQLDKIIQRFSFLHKTAERLQPFDLSTGPCPFRRRVVVYET